MTKKPREPVDPTDMSHPLYDSAKDPLSPFFEGDQSKENLESNSDQKIEDEEKVGPGRPAEETPMEEGLSLAVAQRPPEEGSVDEARP